MSKTFDCSTRDLRAFLAVAEELHFGMAARRMGIAQPPLSQQIKRLEEKVGCPLFVRDTRKVQLTEAGRVMLAGAKHALDGIGKTASDAHRASRGEMGTLSVGFPTILAVTLLPRIVRDFRKANPGITLQLLELSSVDQVERLRAGFLDLAFVNEPPSDPELEMVPVLIEPFVLILPATHRLARGKGPVAIKSVSDEPFIFFSRPSGIAIHDRFMALCKTANFTPHVVQESHTWSTIVGLVSSGLGVSVAPLCVSQLSLRGVVYRPIRPASFTTVTAMMWRKNDRRPALRRFAEAVARHGMPVRL
jgi:DNA-binding transcriptional LysR family regulator